MGLKYYIVTKIDIACQVRWYVKQIWP